MLSRSERRQCVVPVNSAKFAATSNPINFGGIGGFRTIEPGKTWTKQVPLHWWFACTEADAYQITGIYRVELICSPDGPGPKPLELPFWDEFFTGEDVFAGTANLLRGVEIRAYAGSGSGRGVNSRRSFAILNSEVGERRHRGTQLKCPVS